MRYLRLWNYQGQERNSPGSTYGEHKQNFAGQHLLGARLLRIDVGRDETAIREYIRNQEVEDKRLDQLKMWK